MYPNALKIFFRPGFLHSVGGGPMPLMLWLSTHPALTPKSARTAFIFNGRR
jgi:hypothetical protein